MNILENLDQEFEKYKKERNLNISLDDIDNIFFLRDFIQKEGYVSTKIGRTICYRITETYYSWIGYIHRLIIPNPNSIIETKESKVIENKEKLLEIINKMTELSSRNTLIGIKKDTVAEAQFIEDAVSLWKTVSPELIQILEQINAMWKTEKKESVHKVSYSG